MVLHQRFLKGDQIRFPGKLSFEKILPAYPVTIPTRSEQSNRHLKSMDSFLTTSTVTVFNFPTTLLCKMVQVAQTIPELYFSVLAATANW